MFGVLNQYLKVKTQKDTKMKFYKTIVVPILLYGTDSWVVTRRQGNHMQAVEMKFLNVVKGCKQEDRTPNGDINGIVNMVTAYAIK